MPDRRRSPPAHVHAAKRHDDLLTGTARQPRSHNPYAAPHRLKGHRKATHPHPTSMLI
jgi:hypothetical protein